MTPGPFQIKNGISCVVSGGIGISSVATLIDSLKNTIVLAGFRSKQFVTYGKRYPNMVVSTDDGSAGHKGFVTELLELEIKSKKIHLPLLIDWNFFN